MSKLLHIVVHFLNDGSFEARKNGRQIAGTIQAQFDMEDIPIDRVLMKFLSDRDAKDFRDAAEKSKPKLDGHKTKKVQLLATNSHWLGQIAQETSF